MTDQDRVVISRLQKLIRDSELGDKLDAIERWQRFRSAETREEWQKLFGPTCIVLSHQEHFVDFIRHWMDPELSEEDQRVLLTGAAIHDVGEAVVGDISARYKTNADEEAEHLGAIEMIQSLDLSSSEQDELIDVYRKVVAGQDERLHAFFRAFERTEYLDTAIHVYTALTSGCTMETGWYLVSQVLSFDLPKVMLLATRYPNSIGAYLQYQQPTIDRMLSDAVRGVNDDFRADFEAAKQTWQSFVVA